MKILLVFDDKNYTANLDEVVIVINNLVAYEETLDITYSAINRYETYARDLSTEASKKFADFLIFSLDLNTSFVRCFFIAIYL